MTKEHEELLAASHEMLDTLHAQIQGALNRKYPIPVFKGIARFHEAILAVEAAAKQPWDGADRRKQEDALGFAVDDNEAQLMASDRGGRL